MTASDPQPQPARHRALLGLLALATSVSACTFEMTPSTTGGSDEPTPPTAAARALDDAVQVAATEDAEGPFDAVVDLAMRGLDPYSDLRPDEQAIVGLFENTSPSVVYITTITRRPDIFGRGVRVPQGSGTGFLWDELGHVVTNYHVVEGAEAARVVMHDQTSYIATYVGGSPRHDLAVLRIDAPTDTLRRVQVGDSDRVRVGQSVYAIGNPYGLSATLTSGIVSALNRQIQGLTGDIIEDVIQIDASINPGNSGGPLLDSRGRLIGINSQIQSPSGASVGLGFAVPVNTVQRVVPQLIANGEYTPARLGIGVDQRLNRLVAQRLGITGVLVTQVFTGSGAERAGLRGTDPDQLGDIIMRIDGEPVPTSTELRLVLDRYQPGENVTVTISRDGETLDVVVPLM